MLILLMKRFIIVWKILLVTAASISLWFLGQVVKDSWKFWRLSSLASAEVVNWQVKQLSSSRYVLEATYRYVIEGVEFTGKTLLRSRPHLNQYAAEKEIKNMPAQRVAVWYQKSHPSLSSLEKKFPKKELVNAVMTAAVFIYFYCSRGLLLRIANP